MQTIFENIKALAPIVIVAWIFVILVSVLRPQRFRNCIYLLVAIFLTLFFAAALFGDWMEYALLAILGLLVLALLAVPVMLMRNGVKMLKKERHSVANMLSLALGIVVALGEIAFIYAVTVLFFPHLNVSDALFGFCLHLGLTVFYFCVFILAFVLYNLFIERIPRRPVFDYVIIHGCGLIGGEKVSKLLEGRLDAAIEVYNRCKDKPIMMPSGGQGSDEKLSEAQAMKNYLLEKGIPEDRIVLEDKSGTTMENLRNCERLMPEGHGRVALVSSNYHVYRCLLYARKLDMKCVGIGGKVAAYYWPSALLREFAAVFTLPRNMIFILIGYLLYMVPFAMMIH